MTTALERPAAVVARPLAGVGSWVVPVSVAVAVLTRLPFLGMAVGQDEAGFLAVAKQWHSGGTSLYGNYWVDRPPLLISIFRLASMLGGLPALRLIGCLAAALFVLGSARAAHHLAGRTASRWAAVTAAALSVTPLLGGLEVNGELLASPFIAFGIAAVVLSLRTTDQRRAILMAALGGAAGVAAMLVKQNLADVAVFAAVAYAVAWRRREQPGRRVGRLVLGSLAGGAAVVVVLAVWTVSQGTSLSGVLYAMYPFRIQAGEVMAASGSHNALARLQSMVWVGLLSGLVPMIALVATKAKAGRKVPGSWYGLIATIGFGAASVLLGGNYWMHYLIELTAAVSIAIGVLAARNVRLTRVLVMFTVACSAIVWVVALAVPQGSVGTTVGKAIGSAARPGDTIVAVYGHPDVVETSGLASPYAYLWSLPVKTLDPQLTALDAVLAGSAPPTWFVTWDQISSWGVTSGPTSTTVARDYHRVAMICGRSIYLRNGLNRPTPIASSCPPGFHIDAAKELMP
jgi:hypothetical protein